jgi:hypothetical protein
MTRSIRVHQRFPIEMAMVGRLLTRYADLEIALLNTVQWARRDLDATLKKMFRTRSNTQRIDVADALGRQVYRDLKLGTQFEMAVCDMHFCRLIRNQYSHCIWHEGLCTRVRRIQI